MRLEAPKQMPALGSTFRVPAPGETVQVIGVRRRPELNGAWGEVVTGTISGEGCVIVRLAGSQLASSGSGKEEFRVHLGCLRPSSGSASAPSLPSLPRRSPASQVSLVMAAVAADAGCSSSPPSRAARSFFAASPSSHKLDRGFPIQDPIAAAEASASSVVASAAVGTATAVSRETRRQASSVGGTGGIQAMRQRYIAKKAAWKRGYLPALEVEAGQKFSHCPRLGADVTAFEKDFQKTVGVPTYKAYPTEDVVLMNPRTMKAAPPWCP
mmetsp:Transcript_51963/g.134405  ORF Transcript_51963/g.134405 Transcript_51963/m.134405 type:complete len:269 (+) Transcript_51963:37-843(+)